MKKIVIVLILMVCNLLFAGQYDAKYDARLSMFKDLKILNEKSLATEKDESKKAELAERLRRLNIAIPYYEKLNSGISDKEKIFDEYIKYDFLKIFVLDDRATFRYNQKKYNEAITDKIEYLKILKDPDGMDLCDSFNFIGFCFYWQKKYIDANIYYEKAIENAIKRADVLIKEQQKLDINSDEYKYICDRIENLKKDVCISFKGKAWCCYGLSTNKDDDILLVGLNLANQAISLDEKHTGAYMIRAHIKESLRDFDGAIQDYRKAADFGDTYAVKCIGDCEDAKANRNSPKVINNVNNTTTADGPYNYGSPSYYMREISEELNQMKWDRRLR